MMMRSCVAKRTTGEHAAHFAHRRREIGRGSDMPHDVAPRSCMRGEDIGGATRQRRSDSARGASQRRYRVEIAADTRFARCGWAGCRCCAAVVSLHGWDRGNRRALDVRRPACLASAHGRPAAGGDARVPASHGRLGGGLSRGHRRRADRAFGSARRDQRGARPRRCRNAATICSTSSTISMPS